MDSKGQCYVYNPVNTNLNLDVLYVIIHTDIFEDISKNIKRGKPEESEVHVCLLMCCVQIMQTSIIIPLV